MTDFTFKRPEGKSQVNSPLKMFSSGSHKLCLLKLIQDGDWRHALNRIGPEFCLSNVTLLGLSIRPNLKPLVELNLTAKNNTKLLPW